MHIVTMSEVWPLKGPYKTELDHQIYSFVIMQEKTTISSCERLLQDGKYKSHFRKSDFTEGAVSFATAS